MRYGSICSGIEAASAAWGPLGWDVAWFSEIEAFPSRLLEHHYPDVPNLGDITAPDFVDRACDCGPLDIIIGGTPCQSFSVAGLRRGLADDRGNLALRYVEICDALKPDITIWENVPGVLSARDNAFGCFLAGMAGMDGPPCPKTLKWTGAGVATGDKRAIAWRILDAQHWGVAQRRRRVFAVGCAASSGLDPCQILFESESMQGNSAAGREAREDVAGMLSARSSAGGGLGTDVECGGGLVAEGVERVAGTLSTGPHAGSYSGQDAYNGLLIPQAQSVALRGRDGGAAAEVGGRVANALSAADGGSNKAHVLTNAVRRLTPVECERLQGFPDGYTEVPGCSDSARYRALGNSMAVPVIRWLGGRIEYALLRTGG